MAGKRDLTSGNVGNHLVRLGVPMMWGVASVISVSLADAYFLGKLGTDELAAISFVFPVLFTLISLGIGLSAGATSVVSRMIGAGSTDDAQRPATDILLIGAVISLLVSVLGAVTIAPFFSLLGADGAVLDFIEQYMIVWYLGLPFQVVSLIAMGLIRANGDTLAPSLAMVVGALINIGLDPLLIFGAGPIPSLGIQGAAWAAFGARGFIFLVAFALIAFREKLLTPTLPNASEARRSFGAVMRVGLPAAGSNMINPLSISVVTAFMASYGNEAVAAFGVATRIESFATVPMLALSSAIGPVAGQNWGRGADERTRRGLALSFWFLAAVGIVLGVVFWRFAVPIVHLFTDDSAVQNLAISYLQLVGATLAGYGIVIVTSAALNAIDRAFLGLFVTILRSFILYIPLAGAAVIFGPPWLVFAGIALANVIAGLLVAWLAFRWARLDRA
ncbi:MAG: MATE family efflux transporter [Pseudomonadota bacterium]